MNRYDFRRALDMIERHMPADLDPYDAMVVSSLLDELGKLDDPSTINTPPADLIERIRAAASAADDARSSLVSLESDLDSLCRELEELEEWTGSAKRSQARPWKMKKSSKSASRSS